MTIRKIALTGLLGVGALAAGCTSSPPPAATDSTAPAANASAMPPANASVAPPEETAAPPPEAAPAPEPAPAPRPSSRHSAGNAAPPPAAAPAPAPAPEPTPSEPPDQPTAPQGPEIIVETAPPPPRVERFAPRPGYIWTPGYWRWDVRTRHHMWYPGTYVPERSGFTWVPAHWEHGPRGWFFRPGYWAGRNGGPVGPGAGGPAPGSMEVRVPPPAPRIEPVVQRPGFVWTPGYWRWDGRRYDWVAGRYEHSRPGFRWTAAGWERGPNGVWHFHEGYWTPMDPGPGAHPGGPGPGAGGPGPRGGDVVREQPPAPRVEPAPARPGMVWTPGYWRWTGNGFDWVAGRYENSRPGFRWTAASWERGPNGGWHFHEGHWTPMDPGPGAQPGAGPGAGGPGAGGPGPRGGDVVREQPPAPRIEPAPARPGMVWTPGYWRWDGSRFDWVAGSYVPARPGFVWARAHWTRGPGGAWHFMEGHWEPRR